MGGVFGVLWLGWLHKVLGWFLSSSRVLPGGVVRGVSRGNVDPCVYLFGEFVRGLEALCLRRQDDEAGFSSMGWAWRAARVESRVLAGWYRRLPGRDRMSPVVEAWLSRCMGHRLDRRLVLCFPRVAVLCAGVFYGGRWGDCEGVLGDDWGACYLYAGVLGGRLPSALHNRVVLEGGMVDSYMVRRYIRDFC